MSDDLRTRLRHAADRPTGGPDLDLISTRAAQLQRRRRMDQVAATALVLIALFCAGLAALHRSSPRPTQVTSTPTTITRPPSQPDQLLIFRAGGIQVIDTTTGAVRQTVGSAASLEGPVRGPIAVDPRGRTAYMVVAVSVSCPSSVLRSLDLRTGAQHPIAESARAPAVSPNGTRLAYLRLSAPSCTPSAVVVRDLPSGAEQSWQIPDQTPISATAQLLTTLSWAPDGRRLVIGRDVGVVQILDTSRPVGSDNPRTLPRGDDPSSGNPERQYLDPTMLPDGDIVAIQPFCWVPRWCRAPTVPGSGIVTLDTATGNVTSTIVDPRSDPGVQLVELAVDPSGQRLAALAANGTNGLYEVIDSKLRLLAQLINEAAWLPATIDPPPSTLRPAPPHPRH